MKKQILYGLGLVLAAPLCAQGTLYSPKSIDSKTEGDLYGYYGFQYSDGHRQFVDGENNGTPAVITAISMRIDGTLSQSTTQSAGRKWSNVVVSIGEGDITKFSTTFASNFTTTPTVVSSGAWSLPTFSGTPSTAPAPFGGTSGEYTVPFSGAWVYTGKGDIVHDWVYTGGTLDNAAAWATSTSKTYYFDGFTFVTPTSSGGGTYAYLPATRLNNTSTGVTGRCNDSAHGTTTTGSYMLVSATYYAKWYAIVQYRNKLRFYSYSYYTGFENPVIHAYSAANNTTGVDMGTGCNKMHVVAPMTLLPMTTLPAEASTSGYTGYREQLFNWTNALSGVTITAQGGWADSATNAFNMTQARTVTLPTNPDAPPPLRNTAYSTSNTATTGSNTNSQYYNPIFAYSTK